MASTPCVGTAVATAVSTRNAARKLKYLRSVSRAGSISATLMALSSFPAFSVCSNGRGKAVRSGAASNSHTSNSRRLAATSSLSLRAILSPWRFRGIAYSGLAASMTGNAQTSPRLKTGFESGWFGPKPKPELRDGMTSHQTPQDEHGPYRGADQQSPHIVELPSTVELSLAPVEAHSAAGRGEEESPGANSTVVSREPSLGVSSLTDGRLEEAPEADQPSVSLEDLELPEFLRRTG